MPIYPAIYDGPPKGYTKSYSKKRYIAIHNTSNDAPAVNEASYAKRRTDSVSSHYYVDKSRLIQSLNTDYRAWHAGSSTGNTYAIAYEIVGTNSKSRTWWLTNVDWEKLAKQIATDMKAFGIKNKHLSISEMKDGKSTGIVTHDDMRRAWGGTTHNDPGPNFPMDHLIKKINEVLNPAPVKPVPVQEEDVKTLILAREKDEPEVYIGNGITRRWVQTEKELEGVRYWVKKLGGDDTVYLFEPGTINVLGVLTGPDPKAPTTTK